MVYETFGGKNRKARWKKLSVFRWLKNIRGSVDNPVEKKGKKM
jgi:hypothetical protein